METDAGKKYQKRRAGNDTCEALGCFSLRTFFGALALFAVSLFGVLPLPSFVLFASTVVFLSFESVVVFLLSVLVVVFLSGLLVVTGWPKAAAKTSSLAERISLLTVVTF